MAFTPTANLKLLNVPIIYGNGSQLSFPSKTAQTNYFNSKAVQTYTDFTYLRKDNIIHVSGVADTHYNCNYVMYQNENFGNKWFYAFITKIEYINANCTAIHIKTDVFQTWIFDVTLKKSFVVREHVADDTPYLHTMPENIETGDIITYSELSATYDMQARTPTEFDNNYYICCCMSEKLKDKTGGTGFNSLVGGVPDVCYYYVFSRDSLRRFFNYVDSKGQSENIISVYCVLKQGVELQSNPIDIDGATIYLISDKLGISPDVLRMSISNVGMFSGYSPKNNKLLCYPYNYFTLHDNSGSEIDLKPQNFYNDDKNEYIHFKSYYAPSPNSTLTVIPEKYSYTGGNSELYINSNSYEYAISISDFPQIAYRTNTYQNYLALNANSMMIQKYSFAKNALNIGVSQNAFNALSGIQNVASYYANLADMSEKPQKIKGIPSGNILLKNGGAGVFVAKKCIKNEFAKYIDNFFTMYGYCVNEMKVPQYRSRTYWNYIETRDINITGAIPNDDMTELKNMFNSGLTVWHDATKIFDYSQDNAIV